MRSSGIHSQAGVSHGANAESVIGNLTARTRRSRLTGGLPIELWLFVMTAYAFDVSCFADDRKEAPESLPPLAG